MPICAILTLHVRHGQLEIGQYKTEKTLQFVRGDTCVLQYRMLPSPIRSRPASSRAFSSACMHRQVDSEAPPAWPMLQRGPGDVSNSDDLSTSFAKDLSHIHLDCSSWYSSECRCSQCSSHAYSSPKHSRHGASCSYFYELRARPAA
jgi:hypothetical protein